MPQKNVSSSTTLKTTVMLRIAVWLPTISLFEVKCRIIHKAIKTDCLNKIRTQLNEYDVVAIDEGQFFP